MLDINLLIVSILLSRSKLHSNMAIVGTVQSTVIKILDRTALAAVMSLKFCREAEVFYLAIAIIKKG